MCAQLGHCNSVKESNEKRNNPNFAVNLGAYFKKNTANCSIKIFFILIFITLSHLSGKR